MSAPITDGDCVVIDYWAGCPVRAACDLCGTRWSVADERTLDEWLVDHLHPQLTLLGAVEGP